MSTSEQVVREGAGAVVELSGARAPRLRLERRRDGQLWAMRGAETARVWPLRCFPWSAGGRFVSLRDADEEEFALVREPGELDDDSRSALEQSLAEAGFTMQITSIDRCDEEVEIWSWHVQTRQGPRQFQTRRDEWPMGIPGGGYLIRDVAGDLFHVPDVDALDKKSREILWVFVG